MILLRNLLRSCVLAALTGPMLLLASMSNADLINLKMNGLLDETILLLMDKEPPNYDTSPNALIKLKNAGLSEEVIQKAIVLAAQPPPARPAPPPPASAPEPLSEDPADTDTPVEPTRDVAVTRPPVDSADERAPRATELDTPEPAVAEAEKPLPATADREIGGVASDDRSAPPPPSLEPAAPAERDAAREAPAIASTSPVYGDPNLVIGADAAAPIVAPGSVSPPLVQPEVGQTYFTRFTLRERRRRHATTNYGEGNAVPINTPVTVVSMRKNNLELRRLDTGERLRIENVPKHSRQSLPEVAMRLLASRRTQIEKFPDEVARAIRNGQLIPGMTREQVVMARGYPPAHETPSLADDEWIYWESRFRSGPIVFRDGRLIDPGAAAE